MKGVDVLIASVLILIISIAAMFFALQLGGPSTQRTKEILLMQEGKNTLVSIDNSVKNVLTEGEGSTRVLRFSISGGYYKVDNSTNSLIFSMESSGQIIAEGSSKLEDGINFTGKVGMIYLNLTYDNIQIVGKDEFGRGYHTLTIRNNGYNITTQKQMVYISLTPPAPPTFITFTSKYNQTKTLVLRGTNTTSPNNLNDLGFNTYNINEGLESGGQYNYFQASTENITGFNITSADYTTSLNNQNYNVTSTFGNAGETFINSYNQSGQPYIAVGGVPSGDYNNLNALGEGLTYDIPKAQIGTQETKLWNITPNIANRQSVDLAYGSCAAGSLDTINAVYCGNTLGIDANEWGWVNSTHSSNAPSDATITNVTFCWDGYFETATNDNANDRSYIRIGENSTGSWIYTNIASCIGTACNFYTDATRCYDVTSTINTVQKSRNIRISLYHNEADDTNRDIFDDYNYVNITYTRPLYKVEAWHNSSVMSYSGSINSINVTMNFTSDQSEISGLQIYNWASDLWAQAPCQSGSIVANTPYKWWCNVTNNPSNYISPDNKVRIRINSTPATYQGTLKEDYIQYYIGYTVTPTYANISVEHNSSNIPNDPSITKINVTTVLKTNVSSGIPFRLYIFNFSSLVWEQCSQTSVSTSYVKMECIIAANTSDYISDNIRIRLNSSGGTITHQMMEDYLAYQITIPTEYRMEVEHNATGISFSGALDSISIPLNFITNVSSSFNFMIYNFTSSKWEVCDTSNPVANNWYMLWCNKTSPGNYLYGGAISTRLNETSHQSFAEVKEDYIQYYVTYTQ
jgi:hypothetical protein